MSGIVHPGQYVSLTSLLFISAALWAADNSKFEEVLGHDNGVLLTAHVVGSAASRSVVTVHCTVKNLRDEPIDIFEVKPETSYDEDENVVTISVGAEFPVDNAHRLRIAPGAQKELRMAASIRPRATRPRPMSFHPLIRLNLHFLRAIPNHDQSSAADIPIENWFDNIRSVETNSVPVRSALAGRGSIIPPSESGRSNRRGAGH